MVSPFLERLMAYLEGERVSETELRLLMHFGWVHPDTYQVTPSGLQTLGFI